MKKLVKLLITSAFVGAMAFSGAFGTFDDVDTASAYVWGWQCWDTSRGTPPGCMNYPYLNPLRYFGRNYISRDNWHVNGIQGLLNRANSMSSNMADHVTVDGIFGPKTESSVKKYQGTRALSNDGIVGKLTYQSLVYDTRSKKYTYETNNGNVRVIDWSDRSFDVM